jgi:RNA polymerase primary sigma factor
LLFAARPTTVDPDQERILMTLAITDHRHHGHVPQGASKQTASRKTRLAQQRRTGINYVYHTTFAARQTEQKLWGASQKEIVVPGYSLLPEIASEGFSGCSQPVRLTPAQEQTLFLQYNFAKYRLSRMLSADRRYRRQRDMDTWKSRSQAIREKLVHANLPLVPAMARRARTPGVEFSELLSEGYMTVLRCIEHFDVARGFKFSTYACRAILSCFRRLQSKATTYRKHVPMQFDPEMERDDYNERRHDDELDNAVDTVRLVLRRNRAELNTVEQAILSSRHPLAGEEQRMTLRQVGKVVGLSEERVRQIERRSLGKLRNAIEEEMVA